MKVAKYPALIDSWGAWLYLEPQRRVSRKLQKYRGLDKVWARAISGPGDSDTSLAYRASEDGAPTRVRCFSARDTFGDVTVSSSLVGI